MIEPQVEAHCWTATRRKPEPDRIARGGAQERLSKRGSADGWRSCGEREERRERKTMVGHGELTPPNGSRLSCGRLARRRKGGGRQSVPARGTTLRDRKSVV